jgi:hypothetical protein
MSQIKLTELKITQRVLRELFNEIPFKQVEGHLSVGHHGYEYNPPRSEPTADHLKISRVLLMLDRRIADEA